MSQFENMTHAPHGHVDAPAETSKLAITALILNLIICCPCTTIPGTILAIIAIFTTMGNPRKKGTGLAIVALIIGLIGVGLSIFGWGWFQTNFIAPVFAGPRDVLQAGFDGDQQGFRSAMYGTASSATDEEVDVFIGTLRSRYGEFVSVRFDDTGQQPAPGSQDPEQTFPYVITFQNGDVKCLTTIVFADARTGQMVSPAKPTEIVILDPDLGDLTFPPVNGGVVPPEKLEDDSDG